jgi:hypothetical protein
MAILTGAVEALSMPNGRFGKQDLIYVAADDVYLCPAGARRWGAIGPTACQGCALKDQCTTAKERRISRWEHEVVLEIRASAA